MTVVSAHMLRRAALSSLLLVAAEAVTPALASAADGVGTGVLSYGLLDWLNLGFRLALVVAAIWVAVAGMRWYVRRVNGGTGGGGRHVEVIESRALGPNRALHLVRLGGRVVLLGVTAERISALLTIEDADEVQRLSEVAPHGSTALRQAAGQLGGLATMSIRHLRQQRMSGMSQSPGLLGRVVAWLNPLPPRRSSGPTKTPRTGSAAAGARARAAYSQEAAVAAARRAILEARGGR